MDAILHVGVTKTGTTTIQRFLSDNREALGRQGFFVPTSVMSRGPSSAQHIGLAAIASARGGDLVRAAWSARNVTGNQPDVLQTILSLEKDFVGEVQAAGTYRTALLSSEALASLSAEEVVELRNFLSGLFEKVTVLIYLRRQDLHAVSHFCSAMRITLPDVSLFPESLVEGRGYDVSLRFFSECFGKENMEVRLFERMRLKGGDSLTDFRLFCGIADDSDFLIPERQNEKLNAKQVAFLNRLQRASGGAHFPRKRMEEILETLVCHEYFMPARAEAEAYLKRFDKANDWIAREFFGHGGPLFEQDFSMYPEAVSLDDFLDVEDMVQVLVKELDREHGVIRKKKNRDRKRAIMGI